MKTAIYTLNIQIRKNDIFQDCVQSISRYAERTGSDFIMRTTIFDHVLSDDQDYKNVIMEKFHIRELLNYYDRVLYLDADILVKENAPDIFEYYPDTSKIFLYNEIKFNNVDYDQYIEKTKAKCQIPWTRVGDHYDFYNAGVMLVSKSGQRAFEFIEDEYFIMEDLPMIVDEPYLHYTLFKHEIPISELDKRFNTMIYFEDDGWFLHFANVLDRKEKIKGYL
jgi:lipopolysaccharide biosynthesis glycosyltransferase